ncbi:hypothetical protein KQH60_03300 [Mycetohabitans sp. B8]|uniref:hypothetical protein n=1 Tax=Mycetohabitans sp. B8 TaxID=2841845 RepID=UPI001F3F4BA5|nr:hypothetical protein [Mycetohabitans sp. B8]MCG1041649.1 hypothetical protein [Mycetohabitans sp. B8]
MSRSIRPSRSKSLDRQMETGQAHSRHNNDAIASTLSQYSNIYRHLRIGQHLRQCRAPMPV